MRQGNVCAMCACSLRHCDLQSNILMTSKCSYSSLFAYKWRQWYHRYNNYIYEWYKICMTNSVEESTLMGLILFVYESDVTIAAVALLRTGHHVDTCRPYNLYNMAFDYKMCVAPLLLTSVDPLAAYRRNIANAILIYQKVIWRFLHKGSEWKYKGR